MTENNYTNEKYPLSDLTGKIIKCAIEVHKQLGNGFQEVIYQRALAIEFALQNGPFDREFEMPLFYKGEQIGTRRIDFFVDGRTKSGHSIRRCSPGASNKLSGSI